MHTDDPSRAADRSFAAFRRTGDTAALGLAFDATAPELWRVASFLVPRDEVEDLVQDVFLVALRKPAAWDETRPLLPWLLGILANETHARRRRRRRRDREARRATELPAADPAAAAVAAERRAALAAARTALGRDEAELLRLHLDDELTCRQIAERLGRPAGTVRTQVARAMSSLRRRLPTVLAIAPPVALAPTAPQLARLRAAVLGHAPDRALAMHDVAPLAARLPWRTVAVVLAILGLAVATWPADVQTPGDPLAPVAEATTPREAAPSADPTTTATSAPPQRIEIAAAPPAGWILRGAIRAPLGAPIAGATVTSWLRVEGRERGRLLASTTSGADGRYELDLSFWRDRSPIERGNATLLAVAHAPGTHDYSFQHALPANVRRDQPFVLEHDYVLAPYPTLRGRVVDARGRGVPALVLVFEVDGSGSMLDHPTAAADGSFRAVLPTDSPRVRIVAMHAAGRRRQQEVEVARGVETDAGVIVLDDALPLRGRVVLADGTPLPDWGVFVCGDEPEYWYGDLRTDARGEFAAERPQACAWRVHATGLVGPHGERVTVPQTVPATESTAVIEVPGTLLTFRWFDPDGRELLPQPTQVAVFAADDRAAATAARSGDTDARGHALRDEGLPQRLVVPCGAHLLLRAGAIGGHGIDQLVTAPLAPGSHEVVLRYAPVPAATLVVRATFADGAVPDAMDCVVRGLPGASPRVVEPLRQEPGLATFACPAGPIEVSVSGYPVRFDGGVETVTLTTEAGGTHAIDVVLARRGRFAFVLRDPAAPERSAFEDVEDVVVEVDGVPVERFWWRDGEDDVAGAVPPIGLRAESRLLVPVGRRTVTFRADGYEPVSGVVDVREDRLAEIELTLRHR